MNDDRKLAIKILRMHVEGLSWPDIGKTVGLPWGDCRHRARVLIDRLTFDAEHPDKVELSDHVAFSLVTLRVGSKMQARVELPKLKAIFDADQIAEIMRWANG